MMTSSEASHGDPANCSHLHMYKRWSKMRTTPPPSHLAWLTQMQVHHRWYLALPPAIMTPVPKDWRSSLKSQGIPHTHMHFPVALNSTGHIHFRWTLITKNGPTHPQALHLYFDEVFQYYTGLNNPTPLATTVNGNWRYPWVSITPHRQWPTCTRQLPPL